MQRIKLLSMLFIFLLSSGIFLPALAQKKQKQGQMLIKTLKLEDFETPNNWTVKFSRFRAHQWKDYMTTEYQPSEKWIYWKKLSPEEYLYYSKPEPKEIEGKKGTTILGVRGKFYVKGYNWLVVEPKQDLFLMGHVLSLRVWVWGGNFDYDLYAVLKNYRNRFFTIHLGSLKFKGWKQLHVNIEPYGIDQIDQWVPQVKPIQFIRFLIVSRLNERPDRFGIWFDDLEYDTNLFDPLYPGKALEKEFDWSN